MTKPGELSTAEKGGEGRLTPEQAALLAGANRVQADMAGQVEHDGQGNLIEPGDEGQKADPLSENRALLQMGVSMLTPAMPFLPECYTPEVLDNIAGAFTAVCEKYGWNTSGILGPELALAAFAIPPSIAAYKLGKEHFAEQRRKREAEQAQQPGKTAMDGATAGAIGG